MKILIIILTMILANGTQTTEKNYYSKSAQVVEVDRAADVVVVVDSMGEEWEFSECDDWEAGDWCSMVMSDNGTEEIFDDEIISVRYERWE